MLPFDDLTARLVAPLVVAPMTGVSTLALTDAVTRAGVIGSFPVHNAPSTAEMVSWLDTLAAREEGLDLVVPNLVVHRTNARRAADLAAVASAGVPAVITSVGSPAEVTPALHEAGVAVWADIASVHHAHRAVQAGVDGLVLLSAGAGGQTGWANPFAFVRAVRRFWDGPLILAGGLSDGTGLLAAQVAGCDLGYMGTAFIATPESGATDAYRAAVVTAGLDDIELTSEFTGLATSMIRNTTDVRPGAGDSYDAAVLEQAAAQADPQFFSAGHTAAGVEAVVPAADLVARVAREYLEARARFGDLLSS